MQVAVDTAVLTSDIGTPSILFDGLRSTIRQVQSITMIKGSWIRKWPIWTEAAESCRDSNRYTTALGNEQIFIFLYAVLHAGCHRLLDLSGNPSRVSALFVLRIRPSY